MLREYEFTVIANPQLSEVDSKKLFDHYESVLLADGGEIIKKVAWGVKKLAFPIKGQFRGNYVHYDFVGKKEHLTETERLMRIDENILRYMSVKIGENMDVATRKAEVAKAEAQAAQQVAMTEDDDDNDDQDME